MIKTERLEISLSPETAHRLRRAAERRGTSMGHLVREALEMFLREDRSARLRAAQALFEVEAPVADWPQMEQEIRAGYLVPIDDEDVSDARFLAERYPALGPRDLLHVAVMARHGIDTIISADADFDAVPAIRRIDPTAFPSARRGT